MDISKDLENWHVKLEGEWTRDETKRIHSIFHTLVQLTNESAIEKLFNHQETIIQHSHRPGQTGRTRGGEIFLDDDWTDWTMAHELGHRWNNAWSRQPEHALRTSLSAGKIEWFKHLLRRFEKWLSKTLGSLGITARIDWKAFWYHPGSAPPPCGVDRNFNASEDLAESFAATIFPEDAKRRAFTAAKRIIKRVVNWDWGKDFLDFSQTPRGQAMVTMIRERSSSEHYAEQPNERAA